MTPPTFATEIQFSDELAGAIVRMCRHRVVFPSEGRLYDMTSCTWPATLMGRFAGSASHIYVAADAFFELLRTAS
jgi:hypothetical protein